MATSSAARTERSQASTSQEDTRSKRQIVSLTCAHDIRDHSTLEMHIVQHRRAFLSLQSVSSEEDEVVSLTLRVACQTEPWLLRQAIISMPARMPHELMYMKLIEFTHVAYDCRILQSLRY